MNKIFSKQVIIIALIVFISSYGMVRHVHAAEVNIVVNNDEVAQGQPFQVKILLDTQQENANAVQAEVTFPSQLFTLQNINDGASAISLWITAPKQTAPGVIDLAGIIPGGFSGADGHIFSFTLIPTAVGTGTIAIATTSVLEDDGAGSPLPTTVSNVFMSVYPQTGPLPIVPPSTDYTPPNPFTPEITSDPNIFGGKYFLVFNTTDADSGIDHYEVLEVPSGGSEQPFSAWKTTASPYLLTDQSLSSDIYVRAVDHNGNFIVVELPAQNPRSKHGDLGLLAIIMAILMLVLFLWIRYRKKNN